MKTVKSNKLYSILILITASLVLSVSAKGQTKEVIIKTTAQCGECKENIEKALLAERGVKFAELDIKSKNVKVIYNSKKIDPEKIKTTISMTGYDADDIPADEEAVKKLSPCCTKDGHKHDDD